MAAPPSSKLVRVALVASNATGALVLALAALEWTLMDALTPFGFLPVATAAAWLFAASGVLAVVALGLRLRTDRLRAARPLLVQAIVLLAASFVPFARIALELDFRCHGADRERVVELVRAGRLRPGPGLVPLPAALAHVSRGGEVEVIAGGERATVLFFTFRGVLDHYAGFVYSAADAAPADPGDEIPWREVDRYGRHWWWVSR